MSSRRRQLRKRPGSDKSLAAELQQRERSRRAAEAQARQQPGPQVVTQLQDSLGNQALVAALSSPAPQGMAGATASAVALGIGGIDAQEQVPGTGSLALMRVMLYADLRRRAGIEGPDPGALSRIGRRSGRPLPPAVQARMERVFGHDFDQVRIHTDPEAARAAKALQAKAFTTRSDIYFGPGEWQPDTPRGERLLAHELTHVVQADRGQIRPGGPGVQISNPSDRAELEAESMARQAVTTLAQLPDLVSTPARLPIDGAWSSSVDDSVGEQPSAPQGPQGQPSAPSAAPAPVLRKADKSPKLKPKKSKAPVQPKDEHGDPEQDERQAGLLEPEDLAKVMAGVIAKLLPEDEKEDDEESKQGSSKKGRNAPGKKGPGSKTAGPSKGPKSKKPGPEEEREDDEELTPEEKLLLVLQGEVPPPVPDGSDYSAEQLVKPFLTLEQEERQKIGALSKKDAPDADALLEELGRETLERGSLALQKAQDDEQPEPSKDDLSGELPKDLSKQGSAQPPPGRLQVDLLDVDLQLNAPLSKLPARQPTPGPQAPRRRPSPRPSSRPRSTSTQQRSTRQQGQPGEGPGTAPQTTGQGTPRKKGDKDDDPDPSPDKTKKKSREEHKQELAAAKKNKQRKKGKKGSVGAKKGGGGPKMSAKDKKAEIKRLEIKKSYIEIDMEWLDHDLDAQTKKVDKKQDRIGKVQGNMDDNQGELGKRRETLQDKAQAAQSQESDKEQSAPPPSPDDDDQLQFMELKSQRLPKRMQVLQRQMGGMQKVTDKISKEQQQKQEELAKIEEKLAELRQRSGGGGGPKGPPDMIAIRKSLLEQVKKADEKEKKALEKEQKQHGKLSKRLLAITKSLGPLLLTIDARSVEISQATTDIQSLEKQLTGTKTAKTKKDATKKAATKGKKDTAKAKKGTKDKTPPLASDTGLKDVKAKLAAAKKTLADAESELNRARNEKTRLLKEQKEKRAEEKKQAAEIEKREKRIAYLKQMQDAFDKSGWDAANPEGTLKRWESLAQHASEYQLKIKFRKKYRPYGSRPYDAADATRSPDERKAKDNEYKAEQKKLREQRLLDVKDVSKLSDKDKKRHARLLKQREVERKRKAAAARKTKRTEIMSTMKPGPKRDAALKEVAEPTPEQIAAEKRKEAEKVKAEKTTTRLKDVSSALDKGPAERKKALERIALGQNPKLKRQGPAALQKAVEGLKSELQKHNTAVAQKIGARFDSPIPEGSLEKVAKEKGVSVADIKRFNEQVQRKALQRRAAKYFKLRQVSGQQAVDQLHELGKGRGLNARQMLQRMIYLPDNSWPPDLLPYKQAVVAAKKQESSASGSKIGGSEKLQNKHLKAETAFQTNKKVGAKLEMEPGKAGELIDQVSSNTNLDRDFWAGQLTKQDPVGWDGKKPDARKLAKEMEGLWKIQPPAKRQLAAKELAGKYPAKALVGALKKLAARKKEIDKHKRAKDSRLMQVSSALDKPPKERKAELQRIAIAKNPKLKNATPKALKDAVDELKGEHKSHIEGIEKTLGKRFKGLVTEKQIDAAAKKHGLKPEDIKRLKEHKKRQAFQEKASAYLKLGKDKGQEAVDKLHELARHRRDAKGKRLTPQAMLQRLIYLPQKAWPPDLAPYYKAVQAEKKNDPDFQKLHWRHSQRISLKGLDASQQSIARLRNRRMDEEDQKRLTDLETRQKAALHAEEKDQQNKAVGAKLGGDPQTGDAILGFTSKDLVLPREILARELTTAKPPPGGYKTADPLVVAKKYEAIKSAKNTKDKQRLLKDLLTTYGPRAMQQAVLSRGEDGLGLTDSKQPVANKPLLSETKRIDKMPVAEQGAAWQNLSKRTGMPIYKLWLASDNKNRKDRALNSTAKIYKLSLTAKERDKRLAELAKKLGYKKDQLKAAYSKSLKNTAKALAMYSRQTVQVKGRRRLARTDKTQAAKAVHELINGELTGKALERKLNEVSRLTGQPLEDLRRFQADRARKKSEKELATKIGGEGSEAHDKLLVWGRKINKTPEQMLNHLRITPWNLLSKEQRIAKAKLFKWDHRNDPKGGSNDTIDKYRKLKQAAGVYGTRKAERLITDPDKIDRLKPASKRKRAKAEYNRYKAKRAKLLEVLNRWRGVNDVDAMRAMSAFSAKELAALQRDPKGKTKNGQNPFAAYDKGVDKGSTAGNFGARKWKMARAYNQLTTKGGLQDQAFKIKAQAAAQQKQANQVDKVLADLSKGKDDKKDPLTFDDAKVQIKTVMAVEGKTWDEAVKHISTQVKGKRGKGSPRKFLRSMYRARRDGQSNPALKIALREYNKLPPERRLAGIQRMMKRSGVTRRQVQRAQQSLAIDQHIVKTLSKAEFLSKADQRRIREKLCEELGKKPSEIDAIMGQYRELKAQRSGLLSAFEERDPGFKAKVSELMSCSLQDLERKAGELALLSGLDKEQIVEEIKLRRFQKLRDGGALAKWSGGAGKVDAFLKAANEHGMSPEAYANFLARSPHGELTADSKRFQQNLLASGYQVQYSEAEQAQRKKAMGDPDDPGYIKKRDELMHELLDGQSDDKINGMLQKMSPGERKLFVDEWRRMRAKGVIVGGKFLPPIRYAFKDALQLSGETKGLAFLDASETYDPKAALQNVDVKGSKDFVLKRTMLLKELQRPGGANKYVVKLLFANMTVAERAQFLRDEADMQRMVTHQQKKGMRPSGDSPTSMEALLKDDADFGVMVLDARRLGSSPITQADRKRAQQVTKKVEQTRTAVRVLSWKGDPKDAYALIQRKAKFMGESTENVLRLMQGKELVHDEVKVPAYIKASIRISAKQAGGVQAAIVANARKDAGLPTGLDVGPTPKQGTLAGYVLRDKQVKGKLDKLTAYLNGKRMTDKQVVDLIHGCNPRERAELDKLLPGGLKALAKKRKSSWGGQLAGVTGDEALELASLIKSADDYKASAKDDRLVRDLKDLDPRASASPDTPEGLAQRLAWAKNLPPAHRIAELNKLRKFLVADGSSTPAQQITRAFLQGSIKDGSRLMTGELQKQYDAAQSLPESQRDEFLKQLASLGGYADVKKLKGAAKVSKRNLKAAGEYQKLLQKPLSERGEALARLCEDNDLSESQLDELLKQAEENGMLKKPTVEVSDEVNARLEQIKQIEDPDRRRAALAELAAQHELAISDLLAHVNKKNAEAKKIRDQMAAARLQGEELHKKLKLAHIPEQREQVKEQVKQLIEKYAQDPEGLKRLLREYPEGAEKLKESLRSTYGADDPTCVDLLAHIDRAEKHTPTPSLPEGMDPEVSKELQDMLRSYPDRDSEDFKQAVADYKIHKGLSAGDLDMVMAHATHQVKYFDEEKARQVKALKAEADNILHVSDDRIDEIVKRIPHEMLAAIAKEHPELIEMIRGGIGGDVRKNFEHKLATANQAQGLPFEKRKEHITKARVKYKEEQLKLEFGALVWTDKDRVKELLRDCTDEELKLLNARFGGKLSQKVDKAMQPSWLMGALPFLTPLLGPFALIASAALAIDAINAKSDTEYLGIKSRIKRCSREEGKPFEVKKERVQRSKEKIQTELRSGWVSDGALLSALADLNPAELKALRDEFEKPPKMTNAFGMEIGLEGLIRMHLDGDEKAMAVAMLKDAQDALDGRDRRQELKHGARELAIKKRMDELEKDPKNKGKSPQELYKLAVSDKKALAASQRSITKKVRDSANELFKAIDGWGDDEKQVLKTLAGLSPEEIELVKVEYRRHYGKDLETQMREDMGIGNWEPGQGGVDQGAWEATWTDAREGRIALMMMNPEHRVEGLKEFLLEYSERGISEDEDLIFATLENMSVDERTKLLTGPDGESFLRRIKADLGDTEAELVDALTAIDEETGKASFNKAHVAAVRMKMAIHGSGDGWDLSSWGTEEADLLKEMDDLTPAEMQEAIAYYNTHLGFGASFAQEMADDVSTSSPEWRVIQAEIIGDKVAADVWRLKYAANNAGTDESLIEETLTAGKDGRGGRSPEHLAKLKAAFQGTFGQQGGVYADTAGTGQNALQIMLGDELEGTERIYFEQLADKGEADDEITLVYAMLGGGTDEAKVKEVLEKYFDRSPAEREALAARFGALARQMGNDQSLEEWIEGDFSGTEELDMRLLLMGKPTKPEDYLKVARMRHDFERSGILNAVGNLFMDSLEAMGAHSTGSLLIKNTAEIESLFTPDGKLRDPDTMEQLEELSAWQEQDAKNYREVRDAATDAVVNTIQIIASIVLMIIPGGQAAAATILLRLIQLAIAAAKQMAMALVMMAVKLSLKGHGYGAEEALLDLGEGAIDAATAGFGAFMKSGSLAAQGAMAGADVLADGAEGGFKVFLKETMSEMAESAVESLAKATLHSEQALEQGDWEFVKHLAKATAMGAVQSGAQAVVGKGVEKLTGGRLAAVEQALEQGHDDVVDGAVEGAIEQVSFVKHYGLKVLDAVSSGAVSSALDTDKWEAWAKGEGIDGMLLKEILLDPLWQELLKTGVARSEFVNKLKARRRLEDAQAELDFALKQVELGSSGLSADRLQNLVSNADKKIKTEQEIIDRLEGDASTKRATLAEQRQNDAARLQDQLSSAEDSQTGGSSAANNEARRRVNERLEGIEQTARDVQRADTEREIDSKRRAPSSSDSEVTEITDSPTRWRTFQNFKALAEDKGSILGAKVLGDDGQFSPEVKAKLKKLGYVVRKNNVIARSDTGAQVPLHIEDGRIVPGLKATGKTKTPTHLANELLPGGSRGEIWNNAKTLKGQEITLPDGRKVRVTKVVPTTIGGTVDSEGEPKPQRRIAMLTDTGETIYRPLSDFEGRDEIDGDLRSKASERAQLQDARPRGRDDTRATTESLAGLESDDTKRPVESDKGLKDRDPKLVLARITDSKGEIDFSKASNKELQTLGLGKRGAAALVKHLAAKGGADMESLVKDAKLHPATLGKLARLLGKEDEAVEHARKLHPNDSEAEVAHRLGLDNRKYGRRIEVEGVAELHNHFKGILDTEDFPALLFPDEKDPREAARKTLALLDRFYSGDDSDPLSNLDGVLMDHGEPKVSAPLIKKILSSPEAGLDPMATLRRVMTASYEMPFDFTYDPRGAFLKYLQRSDVHKDKEQLRKFVDLTFERLAGQGIKLAEMQGKVTTHGLSEDEFLALARKHRIKVQMLPNVDTNSLTNPDLLAPEEPGKKRVASDKFKNDIKRLVGVDPDDPASTMSKLAAGVDICGPEATKWNEQTTGPLISAAYQVLSEAADKAKRSVVLRLHAGEGYAVNDQGRREGSGPYSKAAKTARNNLTVALDTIEKMKKDGTYKPPPAGNVIIRLGHVTHATDEHIRKMAELGIIAEVNIGSNLATGSLPKDRDGGGRLDEHPLLQLMVSGVKAALSTDAQGVMNTDIGREYGFAADIIDAFKRGEGTVKVPTYNDAGEITGWQRKSYEQLNAQERARIDIRVLHQEAADYAQGETKWNKTAPKDASDDPKAKRAPLALPPGRTEKDPTLNDLEPQVPRRQTARLEVEDPKDYAHLSTDTGVEDYARKLLQQRMEIVGDDFKGERRPNTVTQEQFDAILQDFTAICKNETQLKITGQAKLRTGGTATTADLSGDEAQRFQGRAMEDLALLMQTRNGRGLLRKLAFEGEEKRLFHSRDASGQAAPKLTHQFKDDDGRYVAWNPQQEYHEGYRSDIALVHELKHLLDRQTGDYSTDSVDAGVGATTRDIARGVEQSEYTAMGLGQHAGEQFTENAYPRV